jgi:RNA polymerase sigma-70 factor, ECF subfamily
MADDHTLWELIRAGDASAFDAFYRENARRLEAFLRHVIGSRQAAEDVTQETFAQVWQRPNGFQPSRGTLRAYLYGIGRKRAAEWWRKQGAQGSATENLGAECLTETNSIVADAFRQLPEEQRTLLWLREVEGQSYSELAQILDIPVGTVRSRLFAAREKLRAIWRGSSGDHKEEA